MPIYYPKEKICPILSLNRATEDLQLCEGEKCAWFKGKDDKVDGICAISDTSGWLKNLYELAQKSTSQKPKPKKSKPEDEEVGPEDR